MAVFLLVLLMPTTYSYPTALANWYIRNGWSDGPDPVDEHWYAPSSSTATWSPNDGWRNERQTTSNPDWKIKVAKKQDASTNYLRRETSITSGYFDIWVKYLHFGGVYKEFGKHYEFFDHTPSQSIADFEDTTLADIAVTRLKRKLANRTQSFNAIIPLAELRELRQTVDGAANATMKAVLALSEVKKTSKRLLKSVTSPKKFRKVLKDAYKDASDIWLTYSFGVAPLMGTIVDVNKSISAYIARYDSIDRLTGSAQKTWKASDVYGSLTTCQGALREELREEEFTLSYKYIAGHRFTLASANDYGAADHFGLKPPSLIPAIWELTAFSWVVDYFTTVGAYLDDTFTSTTGNSVYAIENKRLTYRGRTTMRFQKAYPTRTYFNFDLTKNEPAEFNTVHFRRRTLDSYPPRVLRFRTLDEMGLNGVSKLLNLTSVLSKSF